MQTFLKTGLLTALTCSLSLTFSACSHHSASTSNSLDKTRELIEQGHYEAALMRLNKALAEAPRDPKVHINLAWLYLYTDDPTHANDEIEKLKTLDPTNPELPHLEGSMLSYKALQEDPADANSINTVTVSPDSVVSNPDKKTMLEAAVDKFKQSLQKDTANYQTYFDLATALNALNQSQEALNALDQGFDFIPKNDLETQVNFEIASCSAHARLQEFDEAIADCKQAGEFTTNPISKQRIEDMIENMKLLHPKAFEKAKDANVSQPDATAPPTDTSALPAAEGDGKGGGAIGEGTD